MTRPLHITLSPGLPDAGATGQWLGRDRHGAIYTLRWMPEKQCFGALGWRATHPRPWPELVLLQGEQEGFIVGHVEGPEITAPRRSFLGAVLDDLAADDYAGAARPFPPADRMIEEPAAPSWSPWFWTVAMLLGLPALALALVFVLANAPKGECRPAPGAGVEGLFVCRSPK